ncbi:uncharacterized protein [Miscanthus floridulus]|uniref:uncharacterized protein isoform X1 n=1 Tax=Miscanthus floridulus TaxID=154761 RepID=UPI00345B30B7
MSNQRRHAGCGHQEYSGRHLMHEPDRDTPESINARRRDWAKLPRDLAAEIAGRLLGIDLTEYIRFRAVCKPWRWSTDDPRLLNSRFFPRNWVMLSNYGEDDTRRRLLNVATGASIVDDFPELSGHHPLGYAEGLLVLLNTATSGIRLFNPLTRAVTDLPGFSSWSPASFSALMAATAATVLSYGGFGVIDDGGTAASPTMVVLFLSAQLKVPLLAIIRPGESHWALADTSELTCRAYQVSVLSLHGRFYLSTSTGDVLTVELHPEPRLVHVVRKTATPTTTTVPAICSFYLAPSGNDDGAGMLMIMVHASGEDEDRGEHVEVFEVDVDGRRLIPKSTVGADRALFVGSVRALSISTKLFPSIAASANAVYFCHGQGSRRNLFHVFHIDNGHAEPAVELEFFEQMQGREGPSSAHSTSTFI